MHHAMSYIEDHVCTVEKFFYFYDMDLSRRIGSQSLRNLIKTFTGIYGRFADQCHALCTLCQRLNVAQSGDLFYGKSIL